MLFPSSLLVASPLSVCCPLTNLKLSWSLFFPTKIKHISQLGSTSQQGSKTTIATSKLCRWDICCLPIKARNVASLHSWRSTFRLKPSKLSQEKSGLKQKKIMYAACPYENDVTEECGNSTAKVWITVVPKPCIVLIHRTSFTVNNSVVLKHLNP